MNNTTSATEMDLAQSGKEGYVYVLGVADMDLPVCKIGRTARDPAVRCTEINKSSTGDFRWKVEHQIAVSDCQMLESKIHAKLLPLRQKGREFFNIKPEVAITAIQSILHLMPEIKTIANPRTPEEAAEAPKKKLRNHVQSAQPSKDVAYAHLLDSFNAQLKVQGRPFGQLNKPYFGISDGNEGVQWNLAVFPKDDRARLGVNLEGLKYSDWPISKLIKSEQKDELLLRVVANLGDPDRIILRFTRDAWQASARLAIVEEHLGEGEVKLSELAPNLWQKILAKALECLNPDANHLGRSKQLVTLKNSPLGTAPRTVQVSPHLTIWTPIDPSKDSTEELSSAISRLRPIYEWASKVSS